ncbi:hypothetical protein T12_93 [Trichinella patagoniensis]|uniref:Uncharacterized protein n=1 Tax=Trichinella patagoniensis TaxID=990121 RepID=A0A0V0ZUT6_9BILA|nr:hypothetical protein T12_93 [Trichinella patagoniensis]
MECNRQSHLKSNSANQCAIIRGFALRLTLSWGKQTAPHGIKTSIKSCGVENFSTNYTYSKILVQLNLKRTQLISHLSMKIQFSQKKNCIMTQLHLTNTLVAFNLLKSNKSYLLNSMIM